MIKLSEFSKAAKYRNNTHTQNHPVLTTSMIKNNIKKIILCQKEQNMYKYI